MDTAQIENSYGISRIDDEKSRSHAWRVSLRRRGERHIKNFPDKKCGSRERALEKAKHYRDRIVAENPPITRKEVCSIRRSNNTVGITGVCTYAKRYQLSTGGIKENWYWEASWPTEQGKSSRAIFSVNTYGPDLARQMAINARTKGLEAVEGVFWRSEQGELPHYDAPKLFERELDAEVA
jgi:hypothetical protein